MKPAFLFDIDGCLTLPQQPISILDQDLLDEIRDLPVPVAMVTGRSDGWLRKQYHQLQRLDYLSIPTYIEFGLAWIDNGEIRFQEQGTAFQQVRQQFIDLLEDYTSRQDIYFEPQTWYHDFPDHGSLWVEEKHIQLSIAANRQVPTSQVHQIARQAWQGFEQDARILYHHLGVDVIPANWSKAEATRHFTRQLAEADYHWYVFGDNTSDQEMLQGLTHAEFISTTKQASTTVWEFLNQLGIVAGN